MNNMGGLKFSHPRMLFNHFKGSKLHFDYFQNYRALGFVLVSLGAAGPCTHPVV